MSPVFIMLLPFLLLLFAKSVSASPVKPKPATPSIEEVAENWLSNNLNTQDDEVIIICKRGAKKN